MCRTVYKLPGAGTQPVRLIGDQEWIDLIDESKVGRLRELIADLGSVAVAFSGGADSTLLLAVCLQVLGSGDVLAVTADSPTLPRSELAETVALAGELGAAHAVVVGVDDQEPLVRSVSESFGEGLGPTRRRDEGDKRQNDR